MPSTIHNCVYRTACPLSCVCGRACVRDDSQRQGDGGNRVRVWYSRLTHIFPPFLQFRCCPSCYGTKAHAFQFVVPLVFECFELFWRHGWQRAFSVGSLFAGDSVLTLTTIRVS